MALFEDEEDDQVLSQRGAGPAPRGRKIKGRTGKEGVLTNSPPPGNIRDRNPLLNMLFGSNPATARGAGQAVRQGGVALKDMVLNPLLGAGNEINRLALGGAKTVNDALRTGHNALGSFGEGVANLDEGQLQLPNLISRANAADLGGAPQSAFDPAASRANRNRRQFKPPVGANPQFRNENEDGRDIEVIRGSTRFTNRFNAESGIREEFLSSLGDTGEGRIATDIFGLINDIQDDDARNKAIADFTRTTVPGLKQSQSEEETSRLAQQSRERIAAIKGQESEVIDSDKFHKDNDGRDVFTVKVGNEFFNVLVKNPRANSNNAAVSKKLAIQRLIGKGVRFSEDQLEDMPKGDFRDLVINELETTVLDE